MKAWIIGVLTELGVLTPFLGTWALRINEGGRGLTVFVWPAGGMYRVYIAGRVFRWTRA